MDYESKSWQSYSMTNTPHRRQGNQGVLDGASKGQLEAEFGTSKDDEVVAKLLEQGTVVESEVSDDFPIPSFHYLPSGPTVIEPCADCITTELRP